MLIFQRIGFNHWIPENISCEKVILSINIAEKRYLLLISELNLKMPYERRGRGSMVYNVKRRDVIHKTITIVKRITVFMEYTAGQHTAYF
jgi:hypothetical protein